MTHPTIAPIFLFMTDPKDPRTCYALCLLNNPTPETLNIALQDAVEAARRHLKRDPAYQAIRIEIRPMTDEEHAKCSPTPPPLPS